MGMSYEDVDRIAKLIPNEIGITLEQALNVEPQLREAVELDKTAQQLLSTARVLEGADRLVANLCCRLGGVQVRAGQQPHVFFRQVERRVGARRQGGERQHGSKQCQGPHVTTTRTASMTLRM